MRRHAKRMSIRIKILLPVALLIILICVLLGTSAYSSINSGMVQMGIEQADMAAKIAQVAADGDLVAKINANSLGTEEYNILLAELRRVQKQCGIAFLYTLYVDNSVVYFGVDSDSSEEQAMPGDEFEVSYEELADVFGGEGYVQDFIDHTEFGDLISVYKPIYDSTGKVVGVLGCDYDAMHVVEMQNMLLKRVAILAIVCLVGAIIVLGLISNRIVRSLQTVDNKLYDLVHNEGDLTQKLHIRTGDELEAIADNVNQLLDYIRKIMCNISDDSERLNQSSADVVKKLAYADENVTSVSGTMQEMNVAMEETSASVTEIDEAIMNVYHQIEGIAQSARQGSDSSEKIIDRAVQIYSGAENEREDALRQVMEIAKLMNAKIEQSRAVEEIAALTESILSITKQTNMLALNASIEAARAGDAGRGFTVVASQIGQLANNSSEAATHISQVSETVIMAVNGLAEEAEHILKFIEETAMQGYEKLMDVSNSYSSDVNNMNEMMKDFAQTSDHIRIQMDTIKEAVNAVNIAIGETTIGVETITKQAVELATSVGDIQADVENNKGIADSLSSEVNKFKLN